MVLSKLAQRGTLDILSEQNIENPTKSFTFRDAFTTRALRYSLLVCPVANSIRCMTENKTDIGDGIKNERQFLPLLHQLLLLYQNRL